MGFLDSFTIRVMRYLCLVPACPDGIDGTHVENSPISIICPRSTTQSNRVHCVRTSWVYVVVVAAALNVGLAAQPAIAVWQTRGAIRGQVLNGTLDNRPVAGAEVRLWRMQAGQAGQLSTAQTDGRGAFVFTSLPTDGTYLAVAGYRNVTYTSQPLRLHPGQTTAITVTVYEPTTERPAIFFSYRIVLVERVGVGALAFREILEVTNPSRHAYLGQDESGHRVTFRVNAPQGASDITVLRGVAVPVIKDGHLMETAPLPPGSFQIALGYIVRYWGTGTTLRWMLDERTDSMDLFIPDERVQPRSDTLEPRPPGTIRGQRFLRLARNDLRKGQVVEVRLAGLPANFGPLAYWLAALLALALAASLGLSARKAARRKPLESLPAGDAGPKSEPLG